MQVSLGQDGCDLLWQQVRGDIEITHRRLEQQIAHRAADQPRSTTSSCKAPEHVVHCDWDLRSVELHCRHAGHHTVRMHAERSQTQTDEGFQDPSLPARLPTSPLTWYVLLGLTLLVGTFTLIFYTAGRSARAETRGDQLAALLLHEARQIAPIDWDATWQRELLSARLIAAAISSAVFVEDLELREGHEDASIAFFNKHYCIEVRPSPRTEPDTEPDDADPALEVVAWPRSTVGPATSVFFHPEDAESAYSRNLQAGYVDNQVDKHPAPGFPHRRNDGHLGAWDYRGYDDERWLLRERPTR